MKYNPGFNIIPTYNPLGLDQLLKIEHWRQLDRILWIHKVKVQRLSIPLRWM